VQNERKELAILDTYFVSGAVVGNLSFHFMGEEFSLKIRISNADPRFSTCFSGQDKECVALTFTGVWCRVNEIRQDFHWEGAPKITLLVLLLLRSASMESGVGSHGGDLIWGHGKGTEPNPVFVTY
jgi:hypothetical protein